MPSSSGMLRSVKTRSKDCFLAFSRASRPFPAVATLKPSLSRIVWIRSRMAASSSTTKIRILGVDGVEDRANFPAQGCGCEGLLQKFERGSRQNLMMRHASPV